MQRQYDAVDYGYSHLDRERAKALTIITHLFGFTPTLARLRYQLNLFAGGIGVFDRIAIKAHLSQHQWQTLKSRLHLRTPEQALIDADWKEDLQWLVCADDVVTDFRAQAKEFIEQHRNALQDSAHAAKNIYFECASNINSWCVVWKNGNWINYLAFDQG
jgi:hypothetical protein